MYLQPLGNLETLQRYIQLISSDVAEEKRDAVMMLGDMDEIQDALKVLYMSIRFNSPQDKQIIPKDSFRDGTPLWMRGRDFLVHFNIENVYKSYIEHGHFFSTDSPFRNLGECFNCLLEAFLFLKQKRIENQVSDAEAAMQYVAASIALNGFVESRFPSVERLKSEGIDRMTIRQARRYCGDLITEPIPGIVVVQVSHYVFVYVLLPLFFQRLNSLGQLKHFLELRQSEENFELEALIERVIEDSDKESAVVVLKTSIGKNGRDSIQFPGESKVNVSSTTWRKGIEYLKQFGVESIHGGGEGTKISSSSAFANLEELYDYLNDG